MLDVLLTVSEDTPRSFVAKCSSSVEEAARLAGFPVNVIVVPGVPGSIGDAMANGVARAENPYVCWVDDDDFVLPNAFSCLGPALRAGAPAVFARELHLMANGHLLMPDRRHHLTAVRTEIAQAAPMRDNPGFTMFDLVRLGEQAGGIDELSWVYVYRRRANSGGAKIRGGR